MLPHQRILQMLMGPQLSPEHQQAVGQRQVQFCHQVHQLLLPVVFAAQLIMIWSMAQRPGGPWATYRRCGYMGLYAALAVCSLLMYWLSGRLYRAQPARERAFLRLNALYCGLFALWACGVSLLDQLGSGSLGVYIYVLLALAALGNLRPLNSLLIFGGSFLLLNGLLPYFLWPDGIDQTYSNCSNSFFVTLFAVVISIIFYRDRIMAYHDHLIIEEQYEEISRINSQLEQKVVTDSLTGLYNRYYLDALSALWAQRGGTPENLAVLLIDIDYFKQYNDLYGHLAGDQCLQEVAALIRDNLPASASAIRYGGEELAVLLFEQSEEQALELARALQQSAALQAPARSDTATDRVTISVGVAHQPPEEALPLLVLIDRADQALYHAKRLGRNQVAAYTAE